MSSRLTNFLRQKGIVGEEEMLPGDVDARQTGVGEARPDTRIRARETLVPRFRCAVLQEYTYKYRRVSRVPAFGAVAFHVFPGFSRVLVGGQPGYHRRDV